MLVQFEVQVQVQFFFFTYGHFQNSDIFNFSMWTMIKSMTSCM